MLPNVSTNGFSKGKVVQAVGGFRGTASSCSCEIKGDAKKEAAPRRGAVKTAVEVEGVTWSSVFGGVDMTPVLPVAYGSAGGPPVLPLRVRLFALLSC